jgi:hypothetical protein
MREVVEKPLRLMFEDRKISLQDRTALFQEMQSLVIQKTEDSPFKRIKGGTHIKDAEIAIPENVEYHHAFFTRLMELKDSNPAAAKALEEMKRLYCKEGESLETAVKERLEGCVRRQDVAAFLEVPTSSDETEQEVEQEQQVEQEIEAEEEIETEQQSQDQHILSEGHLDRESYSNLVNYLNELFGNGFQHHTLPLKCSWGPSIPEIPHRDQIRVSKNLAGGSTSQHFSFDPATAKNLEARHLLVTIQKADENKVKRMYTVLSHDDQGYLKKLIYQNSNRISGDVVLMTLNGDLVATTCEYPNLDREELKKVCVQVKLYTGKWITKSEIECLKRMVQREERWQGQKEYERWTDEIDRQKVSYLEAVHWTALSRRPAATKNFIGSPLYKFFDEFSDKPNLSNIRGASICWDRLKDAPERVQNQKRAEILVRLIRNKNVSDSELCTFFRDKEVRLDFSSELRKNPSGEADIVATAWSSSVARLLCSERKCRSESKFRERFVDGITTSHQGSS